MPPQADNLWRRIHAFAQREWVGRLEQYYDEDAKLTANAAVVGWYRKSGGEWYPRSYGTQSVPKTGPLTYLGELTSFGTVSRTGEYLEHKFSLGPPALLWSQDLRAALSFPLLPVGACKLLPGPRERNLVETWNAGRTARCASPISPPVGISLGIGSPALVIEYRSDKFPDSDGVRRMKTYIHHFEGDVLANVSPGRLPRAIMFRGGRLRLTKDGLEG